MEYITKTERINTGGNCIVDVLTLADHKVIIISDDYVGLYADIESFFEDDGTACIAGFWLNNNTLAIG